MTNEEKCILLDLYNNNPKGWRKVITAKANSYLLKALYEMFPETYSLSEMLYLLNNNLTARPKCKICGKEIKAFCKKDGYNIFCSCTCAQLDPATREKNKQTNLRLYGVENGAQAAVAKKKYKERMQEKYGVNNAFQADEIKAKIKTTTLKKYGVENPRQNKKIQQKAKATLVAKYGVTCGYHNHEDYHKSKGELELGQFLRDAGFNIKQTDRSTIFPLELDIRLIDYNIGIEYDGTYWHSLPDMIERDKKKDAMCKEKNIILIRIKEKDWVDNNLETKQNLLEQLYRITNRGIV